MKGFVHREKFIHAFEDNKRSFNKTANNLIKFLEEENSNIILSEFMEINLSKHLEGVSIGIRPSNVAYLYYDSNFHVINDNETYSFLKKKGISEITMNESRFPNLNRRRNISLNRNQL